LTHNLRSLIHGSAALSVRTAGPTLATELPPAFMPTANNDAAARSDLVLVPHLEHFDDPVAALCDALTSAPAAVIAYQTPRVFNPAVKILTARDLAIAAAGAGFAIRDFYTEAGLTRLVLERPAPTPPRDRAEALQLVTTSSDT
jgi:hypothetical protein